MIKYLQGLRCYDSDLITIVQLRGLQEYTLLAHCFDFQYNDDEVDLGKAINCPSQIEDTIIQRGGKVVKGLSANINVMQQSISDNKFCIVEVDTFFIPWHPKFRKIHKNHYILLGTFQSHGVLVYDTMCTKTFKLLAYEEFEKSMRSFDVWDFSNYVEQDIKIYPRKEQIDDMLRWKERIQGNDIFSSLHGLEIDSYEVPLYRHLWEIAYGRSLYGIYFAKISQIGNEFNTSSVLWMQIRQRAVWEYMQKSYNKENVLVAIDAAIDFDKNLLQKIYE